MEIPILLKKPFIVVNCAAIPDALIETELFGSEKGAYTGSNKLVRGKFELADKGTLFLDEIGDMNLLAQAKLLRAIEYKKFCRVGGEREIEVDVRIIAATRKDLKKEVQEKRFREDLFYRLSFSLYIPPLRERLDDIPLLVRNFIDGATKENISISEECIELLKRYNYPGNVRQLKNIIEGTLVLLEGNAIQVKDLPEEIRNLSIKENHKAPYPPVDKQDILPTIGTKNYLELSEQEKWQVLMRVFIESNGKKDSVAQRLGVNRHTVSSHIQKLAIAEKLLVALINAGGDYASLSHRWGLANHFEEIKKCAQKLKINKILSEKLNNSNNDISLVARNLNVQEETLRESVNEIGINSYQ